MVCHYRAALSLFLNLMGPGSNLAIQGIGNSMKTYMLEVAHKVSSDRVWAFFPVKDKTGQSYSGRFCLRNAFVTCVTNRCIRLADRETVCVI